MMTVLYIVLGIAQAVIFVFGMRLYSRSRNWYALLAVLPIAFLIYDNFIIAAGTTIGEGELLKSLNAVRFYAHALLTPLLIIFGFGVARRAGVSWAQSRRNHAIFCTLATGLVLMGVYIDVLNLTLEVKAEEGLVRYVNTFFKGPPVPSIVTIIVLAIVGFFVWRKGKSWWMAVGSILMFVGALVGLRVVGVSNLGEVAMTSALVDGERSAQGE